jgi:phosphatidylglycerophosphate synthase
MSVIAGDGLTGGGRARRGGAVTPACEPLVYRIPRRIARRLTPFAVRFGCSPNAITTMWIALLAAAGALVSTGELRAARVGLGAAVVALVLDCLDGEVARASKRTSPLGGFLEGFGQWVGGTVVLVGACLGADLSTAPALAALAAGSSFHVLFLILPGALAAVEVPHVVRGVTRRLLPWMPIDLQVVLLSASLGAPAVGIAAWAALATAIVVVLVTASIAALRGPTHRTAEHVVGPAEPPPSSERHP